jgi:uncharacterized protein (TIGR02246 family)
MRAHHDSLLPPDAAALADLLRALEDAWNAGDGFRYATFFAEDADFVNIFGVHGKGRQAIAERHDLIFRTFFKGSRNQFSVVGVRYLSADLILVHLRSNLNIPDGAHKGAMKTLASCILVRNREAWQITAFHNTRQQTAPSDPTRADAPNNTP